jgi:hypothetical protein
MTQQPPGKIVDSYSLGQALSTSGRSSLVGHETIESSEKSVFWDIGDRVRFRAIDALKNRDLENPLLKTALMLYEINPLVLSQSPNLVLKALEYQTLIDRFNRAGGNFSDITNARIEGCGYLPEESAVSFTPYIIPSYEDHVLAFLMNLSQYPFSQDINARYSFQISQIETPYESLLARYIKNIPNARFLHFSDPLSAATNYGLTDYDANTLAELQEMQEDLAPECLFMRDKRRFFWNRQFSEVSEHVPKQGAIYTADTFDSNLGIGEPVEALILHKFEPAAIFDANASLNLLSNFRDYMDSFNQVILNQINKDGVLILTVGLGNSEIELNHRLSLVYYLEQVARSSGTQYAVLENHKPEDLVNMGIQAPAISPMQNFGSYSDYISRASHAQIAIRVNDQFREIFQNQEFQRRSFSRCTEKAGKLSQRMFKFSPPTNLMPRFRGVRRHR